MSLATSPATTTWRAVHLPPRQLFVQIFLEATFPFPSTKRISNWLGSTSLRPGLTFG
jgi:hypothetical protein